MLAGEKSKFNYKKLLVLVLCFVVYFALISINTPDGLSENGQKAIALMIVAIILWVSEIIPIGGFICTLTRNARCFGYCTNARIFI